MGARGWARAALIGAVCLGIWLAAAADARACECVVVSSKCTAAAQAPAVFVGRVIGWVAGEVLFDVERPVRGVKRGQIRIDAGWGNCAFPFRVDERYVVYAHWDDELRALTTSTCSYTAALSNPSTRIDLAYFDRLAHHQSLAGLISGVLYGATIDQPTPFAAGPRPLAHVVVSASAPGQRSRNAKTDRNGTFEFTRMPMAIWTLTMKLPPGFSLRYPVTVTLSEQNSCNEVGVQARWMAADAPR